MSTQHRKLARIGPSADSNKAAFSTPEKRKRRDDTNDNGGRQSKKHRGAPQNSRQDVCSPPPFACPFYKKDPRMHRKCSNFETKHIGHLKQHIRRKHKKMPFCPLCGKTFKTTISCNDHIRERACQYAASIVEPDGVTQEQIDTLSHRVSSAIERDQQWYCVFDIVFPGHQPRPISPYRQTVVCESTLALFQEQGPRIFIESLQQEVEWALGPDLSHLEPVLTRAFGRTLEQFASSRIEIEAIEEDHNSESTHATSSKELLEPSAPSPGQSQSGEKDSSFIARTWQPVAAGDPDPDEAERIDMPDDFAGLTAEDAGQMGLYIFGAPRNSGGMNGIQLGWGNEHVRMPGLMD